MHCLLGFLTINLVLFIFFTPIFKNSNTDIGNIVCCLLCLTVSPLFKLQWVRPVNRCKCIWTAAKCIWTACKHFRILKFRECRGFFLVKSENIEIFVKAPFQFLGCAGLSAARIYRIWPECLWAASRADCWCTEHRLWTAASCSVIRHLRGLWRSAVWTTAAEWIRSARKYVYNFWLAFCLLILDLTGVAHLQSQDSHIYILKIHPKHWAVVMVEIWISLYCLLLFAAWTFLDVRTVELKLTWYRDILFF